MSRAVCLRCGSDKSSSGGVCPSCGHRPAGEGLLVAWLLSEDHLPAEKLERAAARIRRGESIRPSDDMLDRARVALGRHASADPGMPRRQRMALLATSLVLTPAVGWMLWWWWAEERPRSATQALWLSAPASVFFTALVSWLWLTSGNVFSPG